MCYTAVLSCSVFAGAGRSRVRQQQQEEATLKITSIWKLLTINYRLPGDDDDDDDDDDDGDDGDDGGEMAVAVD